ncbi:MarR family transcriptional regulator [Rhodococcus sp. 06-156-3C]|uniref:MarR family winged helix-turn-helix transcriptional regulator n=1 Tax=Nocardiaceae TaxID=85025 RepID=UPI000690E6DD|nr:MULTISPECIES: MarR family transcriptional regulator [Rhodococcus]OZD11350.1 MarR family transcriptional regulator [Rhodococcus sp. 06-156-3C]OZD13585.1 MarR family transcriptional regulator [Rhodococcus sp. 06-156-4a]OZD22076.1 MarR family transcriptional regulator [Rhodococcus sp. 06-156-4C]OZD30208.1 MarR family transcriptional regulator [Rhodococcus sp. 06-156-3]OZD37616.1 MarR family transcriptional regulator [Rhodococcus sp. 06-156-3b]
MNDDTPWLSHDEIRAWLTFSGLLESLPQLLSAQLKKDASMNSYDYMVLAGLSESPNHTIGMTDLAAFAAGSLSRLSHALTKMEKRGWVRRQPVAENGRQTEVVLTSEGMSAVQQAAPGHVRLVRQLFIDTLGEDQAIELGRLANLILTEVNPAGQKLIDERYAGAPAGPHPASRG